MKGFKFKVNRRLEGDRPYNVGDDREMTAAEAAPMVRSGALTPANKEAEEAVAALLGPKDSWGVRPAMETDHEAVAAAAVSPLTVTEPETPAGRSRRTAAGKDAGAADLNKDAGTEPAAGEAGAAAARATAGEAGAATASKSSGGTAKKRR